jgi:CHAT domain-containing protein/tetratricopeptide (TPR) repeat protein
MRLAHGDDSACDYCVSHYLYKKANTHLVIHISDFLRKAISMARAAAKLACVISLLVLNSTAVAGSLEEAPARADSLARAQNRAGAIELSRQTVAECEKRFGASDTSVAMWLNRLGIYYYQDAAFDSAESVWRRSLRISESSLGPNHPAVAKTLNNLAILARDRGQYALAEPLYKRAMAIWERAYGPDHALVATAANNLGYCYQYLGRYAEAEILYKRGLAGWTKAYGPINADVARAIINLAGLYQELGRFAAAEARLREALAVMQQVYPSDNPDVAYCLNNLALVCWKQARSDEAEALYQQALAIYERTLGPEHPYLSYSLNGLATINWERGDFEAAEALMLRALAIRKKSFGGDNPDLAQLENDLAIMYVDWGRVDLAEPLEIHALEVREKAFGRNHPDVAQSLLNIAALKELRGEDSAATELTNRALAIYQSYYNGQHESVANALEFAAELDYKAGGYEKALAKSTQACGIRLKNFQANGAALSERDALAFSGRLRGSLSRVLTCYFQSTNASSAVQSGVAELILQIKGQVSDQVFEQRQWLAGGDDPGVKALREQLLQTKYRMSELYVQGSSADSASYQRKLDSLEQSVRTLESDLARKSVRFREHRERSNVSVRAMRQALPGETVLVEYLKYDRIQWPGNVTEARYLALLIKREGPAAILDIGKATVIDSLVREYRAHLLSISRGQTPLDAAVEAAYRSLTRNLAEIVWRPVEQYAGSSRQVMVACDGALNTVSFAGLPDTAAGYLVERFAFHYLSSGRDLIHYSIAAVSSHGLLAVGDPDYFSSPLGMSKNSPTPVLSSLSRGPMLRGYATDCATLRDMVASPLPGTRKEISLVIDRWRAARRDSVTVLLGADANELNFKRLAPSASVVHLATHGYYLEDTCRHRARGRLEQSDLEPTGRNPLLLCGLLLAGANNRDTVQGGADGILTAYEVSEMNLANTQMVVLSACESGLGETVDGEGVYGLRRAFQMAGVRTILSALWPIADDATAGMMGDIYDRRHSSLPKRLREIALNQLQELRKNGKCTHPYSWAGFIAIGDWR